MSTGKVLYLAYLIELDSHLNISTREKQNTLSCNKSCKLSLLNYYISSCLFFHLKFRSSNKYISTLKIIWTMNIKGNMKKKLIQYVHSVYSRWIFNWFYKKKCRFVVDFFSVCWCHPKAWNCIGRVEKKKEWRLRFFVIDWNTKPNIRKKIVLHA